MSEELPTPQLIAMLKAQEGKRAVYRGTGVLAPVIIEEVRCGADFEAKLVAVEGIVLCIIQSIPQYPTVLKVSAAWGMFSAYPTHWMFGFPGCCWQVQLDEAACDAAVRLCQEKTELTAEALFRLVDRDCLPML